MKLCPKLGYRNIPRLIYCHVPNKYIARWPFWGITVSPILVKNPQQIGGWITNWFNPNMIHCCDFLPQWYAIPHDIMCYPYCIPMVRYGSFTPHFSIHTSCSSADHMKLLPAETGTCLTLEAGVLLQKQLAMDQYLLIPFLVGWTSIYQLFWCSPGG